MSATNGTLADVATFFRVSEKTVRRWVLSKYIGCQKIGARVLFGEQDIVDICRKERREVNRRAPGEADEIVRRDWKLHLSNVQGLRSKVEEEKKAA